MRTNFILSFMKFNGLSWITKSPASWIANIVTPTCLLFVIYVLSAGKLMDFAVAGGFVAIVSTATLVTTGESAMFRLEFRLQDLIIATRVGVVEYALGFAFASLVFCAPGIAFFSIISIAFGLFSVWKLAATFAVIFMLALATTSIAMLVGSRIRRTIGMWSISGIVSAFMSLIPPTFYPYTELPKTALYLLAISPVTPAAVTIQGIYGLAPMNYYMPVLLVLEVLVYMAILRKFAKWREE